MTTADWIEWLLEMWHYLIAGVTLLATVLASGHVVMWKRDSRAAVAWLVVIWIVPLLGALLYSIFGINRIKRRAILLRGGMAHYTAPAADVCSEGTLAASLPSAQSHLITAARSISRVTSRPLLPGNAVTPLINGDAAYPAMLEAIAAAQHSISLSTYIFDSDATGRMFAHALGSAVRRGVAVRVLVDATGKLYSWPTIAGALCSEHVRHAFFMPTFPQVASMNLRSHRKIMVVDGRIGFTGGLNIREGHWLARLPAHPVRDIHFRLEGPVVAHLQEVFADDWFFTTREALRGDLWFPALASAGTVTARGIADGPDEDFENLRWAILAALTAAQKSVRIATPYFLPERSIITSLNLAAMRGVTVDILLPSKGNLPFVQWASTALLWQVIGHGCRIWQSPPPFDHSKLFIVDDCWTLIGSTNWDPRSLRLNFEFNVECYDPLLAQALSTTFDAMRAQSSPVTLAALDSRPLPIRLRDGVARLFTPYL